MFQEAKIEFQEAIGEANSGGFQSVRRLANRGLTSATGPLSKESTLRPVNQKSGSKQTEHELHCNFPSLNEPDTGPGSAAVLFTHYAGFSDSQRSP